MLQLQDHLLAQDWLCVDVKIPPLQVDMCTFREGSNWEITLPLIVRCRKIDMVG